MCLFSKAAGVHGLFSVSNCSTQGSLKKSVGILHVVSIRSWEIAEGRTPKLSTFDISNSFLHFSCEFRIAQLVQDWFSQGRKKMNEVLGIKI